MFRRQTKPAPARGGNRNLAQFGLLDIGGDSDVDMEDVEDEDLEAELAALAGPAAGAHRPKTKPKAVPAVDLDAMIAASLRDVASDEEVASGDEDDPELLSELQELSVEDSEAPAPPPRSSRPAPQPPGAAARPAPQPPAASSIVALLQDRLTNYTVAEKNAKAKGESARARRFERGIKTLQDLLKQAKAGKPISEDDIPPVVSTGQPAPQPEGSSASLPPDTPSCSYSTPCPPEGSTLLSPGPSEPSAGSPSPFSPSVPSSPAEPEQAKPEPETDPAMTPERQKGLRIILQRREEFKAAALSAKRAGDKARALDMVKMVKTFDLVVEAYRAGQEMDLAELPTVPPAGAATHHAPESTPESTTESLPAAAVASQEELVTATSVEEALRQHLAIYKEQEARATETQNASKARRMGRIVKQYERALEQLAKGATPALDELPCPPGFAPIPTPKLAPKPAPKPASATLAKAGSPVAPRAAPRAAGGQGAATPRAPAAETRAAKQLDLLLRRQKEFKEAALEAKKKGDISLAKEYLRNAKGFDSLIEAAEGGLAVDLTSLPLPPQEKLDLDDTFEIVAGEECAEGEMGEGGEGEVGEGGGLLGQLSAQLRVCGALAGRARALGCVADVNRLEQLARAVKQDMEVVALATRAGGELPKFHFEQRVFSMVQCNTDLNDNDLELSIVRGIAYNVPNPREVDTYVKFEFPYPQEEPVHDKTGVVKDTNSPVYGAVFPLSISRGARACLRVFKRHAIKLEVWSRGGFFSRDHLLGTVTVKLQQLETQITIHDSFPLMDGRRAAGGSLEVKVRVRSPLLAKQVEQQRHRWLVLDS